MHSDYYILTFSPSPSVSKNSLLDDADKAGTSQPSLIVYHHILTTHVYHQQHQQHVHTRTVTPPIMAQMQRMMTMMGQKSGRLNPILMLPRRGMHKSLSSYNHLLSDSGGVARIYKEKQEQETNITGSFWPDTWMG